MGQVKEEPAEHEQGQSRALSPESAQQGHQARTLAFPTISILEDLAQKGIEVKVPRAGEGQGRCDSRKLGPASTGRLTGMDLGD